MLAPIRSQRVTIDRKVTVQRGNPDSIAACLRGDQKAWDALVERYGRLVYSITRRYGLCDADADDVFQSVFITVHRKLDTLKDHTRFSAWLITTTHRECWRVGKRSGIPTDLDDRIADVSTPAPEQIEAWEQQHLVHLALEQLGGPCEKLLRALFMDNGDANYQAIADRLGIPVGSIGPTRARCFKKLKRILGELGVEAPMEAGAAPSH